MKKRLFGLNFDALDFPSAVHAITSAAKEGRRGLVVTPNVDHIVTLSQRPELYSIYRSASFVFADGAPVLWVSRLVKGAELPECVTGADLLPALCERAAQEGLRVAFVGGNPGVADSAAKVLLARHPGLNIVGTYCPPMGFETNEGETKAVVDFCNRTCPQLLFFGVGAPKQEIWSHAHLAEMNVGQVLCIGAAFDFVAGTVKRAPVAIRKLGFEWAWRLMQEPGRMWRRYLRKDTAFFAIALKEIFLVGDGFRGMWFRKGAEDQD